MQQSSENQVASQNNRALKQTFSCLVDAMRFAYRKDELEQKIEEIQTISVRSMSSLDELNQSIADLIRSLNATVDHDAVKDLGNQITSFSLLAIEQVKSKLKDKISAELSTQQSNLNSERTKTFKSLEAFIITSPFPIRDKITKLKVVDGAYEARGTYNCFEDIQYELTYDTKKSRILSSELRLSAFEKDIRIPISLGKSWLRKEQVPEYERIDQYFLESAESAESNLIAIFKHVEKDAKIKLIYSRIDRHSTLSVEYADSQKSTDITATPGLNKYLNSEPLERAMERLWLAIAELENNVSGLAKLQSDGRDVLEKLDCFPFFAKSWKMIAPRVTTEIKSGGDNARPEGRLNEAFVREKLATLGKEAAVMLETLGLKEQ
ncbi:MAG: hypothetical protein ACYC7D_04325 [Nitrososphaerales archaeon]